MQNWKLISKDEHDYLWGFVFDKLRFRPHSNGSAVLTFPMENRCCDISMYYNDGFNEEIYADLHKSSLECFKQISHGERLYALNWQHDCYSFLPNLPFEENEFGEWLISVFPNGDYIFFFSNNLANGIFADGINMSLYYFGEEIIKCAEVNNPLLPA